MAQRIPSVKRIKEWFNLDHSSKDPDADAEKIRQLLQKSHGSKEAEKTLQKIDKIVDGFGVETIRGDTIIDYYFRDIVAFYINTGDTYSPTLLYKTETGTWLLTTWGDWVERNDSKYKIGQVTQY